MARLPRLIVAGLPHLICQRTQHGQTMLRDDEDRSAFMQLLRLATKERKLALHAYAVQGSGFDLLVTPPHAADLSGLMQTLTRRYTVLYNRRHGRAGGLWEGRFRTAVVEPGPILLDAMRYAEQALQRQGLVAQEDLDRCSSAAHHQGRISDASLADPPAFWSLGNTPFEREAAYSSLLEHALTSEKILQIEAALRGGWALGSAAFVAAIGDQQSRPAAPRQRGRPPRVSPP